MYVLCILYVHAHKKKIKSTGRRSELHVRPVHIIYARTQKNNNSNQQEELFSRCLGGVSVCTARLVRPWLRQIRIRYEIKLNHCKPKKKENNKPN
jgi:hypothetical protein